MTDARTHPRLRLTPMVYVDLAQNNGGILLNLSEGGLAVQSALMLAEQQLHEIRFQLPGERDWVKANTRVAWISESRKEAGVEFLDFSEESRLKIRQWMAAESAQSSQGVLERPAVTKPVSAPAGGNVQHGPARDFSFSPGPAAKPVNRPDVVRGTLFPAGGAPPGAGESAPLSVASAAESGTWAENWAYQLDAKSQAQWAHSETRNSSWRGWTLLSVAIAILFFVLGATVGRGSVDFAVNYITALRLSMMKPSTQTAAGTPAPASAADQNQESGTSGEANSAADGTSSSQPATVPDSSSPNQPNSPPPASADTQSAPAQSTAEATSPGTSPAATAPHAPASTDATPKTPSANAQRQAGNSSSPAGSVLTAPKSAPKQKAPADDSLNSYAAQDLQDLGRTMIVTAPAPGSPPYRVSLRDEAVSASASVAISSRRSFRVPALPPSRSTRSERVMIGKLISHSDPYYPADARHKRIDGTVQIRATIGMRGEITNMDIVSGPPELVSAALTAIREWRYEPTFIDGDPIQVDDDITMVFRAP